MEVKNSRQNLGFGAAFIKFNQAKLHELPENAQRKVSRLLMLRSNLAVSDGDLLTISKVSKKPTVEFFHKTTFRSNNTGNTGLYFSHINPKKEKQLVRIFNKLFKHAGVETELIPNMPENAEKIENKKGQQLNWVKGLS